ncbi:hypothetical protein [Tunicatimonas pelagia]|uniref:hypothetical protein n=1 Tax=Tunicatimonas pelagia TaxID=931531 RepID=UPI002665EAC2|nr:hypothetical protein [Tunicatimonas pelagia]WKN45663.1 hypothetical protein P0M28_11915 [Tunicatimonas pelagia]
MNKKHLLIVGKTEAERRKFINDLIQGVNFEVFRFPSRMKLFDEYCDFIKKEKIYEPWYKAKGYNVNQILDFHWDWISENNSLIIMEEFEQMEKRWRIELLRIYLNEIENRKKDEKKIHLIISQESENGLIEKLSEVMVIRESERRTEKQIVEQNLETIDISE